MTRLHGLFLIILFTCHAKWTEAASIQAGGYKDELRSLARILTFSFRCGSKSMDNLPTENILVSSETIDNLGPDHITHSIKASATVKDKVVFKIAEPFTELDIAMVTPTVRNKCQHCVPVIIQPEVQFQVESAYKWNKAGGTAGKNITVLSDYLFQIDEEIKVPPCNKCVAQAFVKLVKDFRVDYTALATVATGVHSSHDPVPHPDLITVEGSMHVDFGQTSFVVVNCEPLQNCQAPTNSLSSAHYRQIYQGPNRFVMPTSNSKFTIFSFLKNAFGLIIVNLG